MKVMERLRALFHRSPEEPLPKIELNAPPVCADEEIAKRRVNDESQEQLARARLDYIDQELRVIRGK